MRNPQGSDRRQDVPRREGRDRRRLSDPRYAMIEVCRSHLHMVLVNRDEGDDGDKVVTRSIKWRRSATSLHTELGEQELIEAFRALAAEGQMAGAKTRIALSGEFCVTRVVTGSTDDVRRELTEMEERSLRYLTLGPGRKELAGQIQQLDVRHQHAVLAVANQQTLDLLMRIAEEVNLQIEAIEPSLIALSRCQAHLRSARDEACLIVQLDDGKAELGICHRGRLLLEYRPSGQANSENISDIVSQHWARLVRFLERYHGHAQAPLRQIYLTGEPSAVAVAKQAFSRFGQLHVEVLDPSNLITSWQYVGNPPGTDMAAALGLALLLDPAAAEQQGPNLIERTLAEFRPPMRPVLVRSLSPVAAVLLVAATLFALHLNERHITTQLRAELELLQPVRVRATELGQKLTAAEVKLTQLRDLAERLPRPNWQGLLGRIGQSMPDDVWLDRLTLEDGRSASLTGASYSDTGIYDFVGYLKHVPDITETALEGTGVGHTSTGPTTNFDLRLTLASPAGSNDEETRDD